MKKFACAVLALGLLASASAFAQPAPAPVAGKVVAVSHEKVNVNNAWLDKVTVTVDSCAARGTLKTVHYLPATISDRTALGHLFQNDLQHARTPNMEKQQQTNGFGVFWTDATGRVTRTGLLGHQVGCGDVPKAISQFK